MNYLKISSVNQELYEREFKNLPNRLTPSKIPKKFITWMEEAHKKWLNHTEIYKNFDVIFFNGKSNVLGYYVIGTYERPLIFLYLDAIEEDAYLDGLEGQYKIIIYHELAHALCQYQRKLNHRIVKNSKEESFVEMLSRRMHYNHSLQPEFCQMAKLVRMQ